MDALFDMPPEAYAYRSCQVCGAWLAQPPGDTYVMQRQGWVKIGKSKHPWTRLKELRAINRQCYIITPDAMDCAEPIGMVAILEGDTEHALHERFAADHVAGEWFLPGPEMRSWLAGLPSPGQPPDRVQGSADPPATARSVRPGGLTPDTRKAAPSGVLPPTARPSRGSRRHSDGPTIAPTIDLLEML